MPPIPTLSPSLVGTTGGSPNNKDDDVDETMIEETMSEIRQNWSSILQEQVRSFF